MDLGKIIVGLMSAVLIVFCLVASVLYLLPLYQKIQMDQICRTYMYEVNASEGMTLEMKSLLEKELSDSGLLDIEIKCPGKEGLKRRETQPFLVRGILILKVPTNFLVIGEQVVHYEFKGKVYGKRIIN